MIKTKEKQCKGTGPAINFTGCGCKTIHRKYGLCLDCYRTFLLTTDEGKDIISKNTIKASSKVQKEKRQRITQEKKSRPVSANFNIYTTTAWKWCSRFVLLKYADEAGFVRCSTSPNLIYHVTDSNIHCGHLIKYRDGTKSNIKVAFDFRNLAPQSAMDNVKFSGKPEVMKQWLIQMHGQDEIDNLYVESNQICKLTKYDLDEIAKYYRILFNNLLQERGIANPWK